MTVWIISIATGFFIEVFFKLLKRNKAANPPTKYIPYNNYVSVAEFVNLGNRRWINYLVYRLFPPALLLTLSIAIYQKYYGLLSTYRLVIVSTMLSLIPRDIYQMFSKDTYYSEKAVHLLNILSLSGLAILLSFMGTKLNITLLAPSVTGIVDNSWSSLLVAMLVLLYADVTNQNNSRTMEQGAFQQVKGLCIVRTHKNAD
jgi:hypothetical protein